MLRFEGGIVDDLDGAVACGDEEVQVRGFRGCDVVRECGSVCLDGLWVRFESFVGSSHCRAGCSRCGR